MAHTVLGIGTSHSPLLAISPELWAQRAVDDTRKTALAMADGRTLTYDELNAEVGGCYADQARPEVFERQHAEAQHQLGVLAEAVKRADLDALVVIGDDQDELFARTHLPSLAVYNGPEIVTHPKNETHPELPEWYREANKGYRMDTVHRYPTDQELANSIVDGMIARGVDLALASKVDDPYAAGFGHAYGFVMDRLGGDNSVPIVPVMLNTYYPPNVPRPGRCWQIGTALRAALDAEGSEKRVGVVASGGLSHFVVDEHLDRSVIDALKAHDVDALSALDHEGLRSGNSEILNWIMTGAAMSGLEVTHDAYVPVTRTEAGTGVGLAFLVWEPAA